MNSIVRRFEIYRDTHPDGAINPHEAMDIYQNSVRHISWYTGRIALSSLRSLHVLPAHGAMVNFAAMEFPTKTPHALLLTRQPIADPEYPNSHCLGIAHWNPDEATGMAVTHSRAAVWVPPQKGGHFKHRAEAALKHEIAHTFGLPHCNTKSWCLMAFTDQSAERPNQKFCGDCTGRLSSLTPVNQRYLFV